MGQVIGKSFFNGYAGAFTRQPDSVIDTHPAAEKIVFGQAVAIDAKGAKLAKTADDFAGIAGASVKTPNDYANQSEGSYEIGETVAVVKRGCIAVHCQNGTPAYDGDVYVRIKLNNSLPKAVVGGFEATADVGNNVKLTNVKWRCAADVNGVAEVRILSVTHA